MARFGALDINCKQMVDFFMDEEFLKQMRTNMDPLTPTTSTLSPAISHIAETAAALAKVPQQRISKRHEASKETGEVAIAEKKKEKETGEVAIAEKKKEKETGEVAIAEKKKKEEKETVRWVLQAPQRLRSMRDANRGDEAAKDWNEVRRLLEKWEGVAGVDEIQNECMQVMA